MFGILTINLKTMSENNENNENIDTSEKLDKIDLLKSSIDRAVYKYLNNSTSTSTF